jgi:hypothetical protein
VDQQTLPHAHKPSSYGCVGIKEEVGMGYQNGEDDHDNMTVDQLLRDVSTDLTDLMYEPGMTPDNVAAITFIKKTLNHAIKKLREES